MSVSLKAAIIASLLSCAFTQAYAAPTPPVETEAVQNADAQVIVYQDNTTYWIARTLCDKKGIKWQACVEDAKTVLANCNLLYNSSLQSGGWNSQLVSERIASVKNMGLSAKAVAWLCTMEDEMLDRLAMEQDLGAAITMQMGFTCAEEGAQTAVGSCGFADFEETFRTVGNSHMSVTSGGAPGGTPFGDPSTIGMQPWQYVEACANIDFSQVPGNGTAGGVENDDPDDGKKDKVASDPDPAEDPAPTPDPAPAPDPDPVAATPAVPAGPTTTSNGKGGGSVQWGAVTVFGGKNDDGTYGGGISRTVYGDEKISLSIWHSGAVTTSGGGVKVSGVNFGFGMHWRPTPDSNVTPGFCASTAQGALAGCLGNSGKKKTDPAYAAMTCHMNDAKVANGPYANGPGDFGPLSGAPSSCHCGKGAVAVAVGGGHTSLASVGPGGGHTGVTIASQDEEKKGGPCCPSVCKVITFAGSGVCAECSGECTDGGNDPLGLKGLCAIPGGWLDKYSSTKCGGFDPSPLDHVVMPAAAGMPRRGDPSGRRGR